MRPGIRAEALRTRLRHAMPRGVNFAWNDLSNAVKRRCPALVPYLPAAALAAFLGYKSITAILARAGHPAVPLDDSFIHFQYAKNLAAGHFFSYMPGEGYSAGATSFVWPMLLAPFYLVGFHDLSIIWIAWILGFAAHAGVMVETYRLASRLTGRSIAIAAGAMSGLFGGFVWFAASGMETVLLAWALTRTARIAAEWCETPRDDRTKTQLAELVVFGILGPLVRPEGAVASMIAATAIAACPLPSLRSSFRTRAWALAALVGPLLTPAINFLFTGAAASNTTAVKWLPLVPYYADWPVLRQAVWANVQTFFTVLLDGHQWSAVFVPKDNMALFVMGLVSIPVLGWRTKLPWRTAFVLVLALGMLLPCTYVSFLWNRLRYLWPFVPGWFVGLACAARLLAELAASIRPRWIAVGPVLAGLVPGAFSTLLSWTIEDLSKSAAAIDLQQVKLGRWAKANLPQDAILGVNDTGAIAYTSDRRTFDVVGLTTKGEAKYWVAGAGSRFEHYEKLVKSNPERFPTHFIVYARWMSCEPVLGEEMHEATVIDQSILGDTTMTVYPARRDLLGTGDRPLEMRVQGRIVDELDVADLESEAEHRYEIQGGTGNETSNRVHWDTFGGEDAQRPWADGGRYLRTLDRFEAHLPEGKAVRGIVRFVGPSEQDAEVAVRVGGQDVATLRLPAGSPVERAFEIPAAVAGPKTVVEVKALGNGTFASLHYWFEVGL